MAGIEIAGLVLGAVPLLISALENYEKALDPTIAFIRWKGCLFELIQSFTYHKTSLDQSIRILLHTITTNHDLDVMINDLDNALWKSECMTDALQSRLGDAYQPYMQTLRQISEITRFVAENLNIEGAEKISQHGLQAIILANPASKIPGQPDFQFRKRVKFTMKRKKVKRLIDELGTCTTRLDTYTNKAERLEFLDKPGKKSVFAIPLDLIEENAARLYDVLARTWCSAHSSHHAGLLLEQRLVRRKKRITRHRKEDAEACDDNCLAISLLRSTSPAKWLEVEVRLVEAPNYGQKRSSKVQVVLSRPFTPRNTQAPYLDLSQLQIVTDLCSIIKQPCHPLIGLCLDSNGDLRGVYPAQPRALTYVEKSVSLAELLVKQQWLPSRKEVYNLCVTLSSSLLQLSQTPWLSPSWDKANIIFHRAKYGSASSVDVGHPYLTREHTSKGGGLGQYNTYPAEDHPKLLALGVLLVEINSAKPIESMWLQGELGPNGKTNASTNPCAVQRWLQEERANGNLSIGFHTAISHCLHCYTSPAANLQDSRFPQNSGGKSSCASRRGDELFLLLRSTLISAESLV